ncbi:hypothetical protein [Streptomyces evansiae]|uniref:hypothetical protein n=1 Tax=Streptomyces evansiae TaxID=3075535 RepID=UPI002884244B|nr:hypothetical protein [Streptomyces sp. DSM 41859]MDT0423506.1 hypothetical protein [Streptomyces sp. DSM 41859]
MTANRVTGWRIERVPKPMERTKAGRFALPLRLVRDGEHIEFAALVLSGDEAEQLLGDLSRMLGGKPCPPSALDPVGGPTT